MDFSTVKLVNLIIKRNCLILSKCEVMNGTVSSGFHRSDMQIDEERELMDGVIFLVQLNKY